MLSYPSGLILVINSLLAGALVGLLSIALFRAQLWMVVAAGLATFALASAFQYQLAARWFAAVRRDFQPRFPQRGGSVVVAAETGALNEA